MKSLGCFKPCGTKNQNVQKGQMMHHRRNSRQSAATTTNIDFEYTGNTNHVNHLIKSTKNANRHPSNLNFELNLRTYEKGTKFLTDNAFQYP